MLVPSRSKADYRFHLWRWPWGTCMFHGLLDNRAYFCCHWDVSAVPTAANTSSFRGSLQQDLCFRLCSCVVTSIHCTKHPSTVKRAREQPLHPYLTYWAWLTIFLYCYFLSIWWADYRNGSAKLVTYFSCALLVTLYPWTKVLNFKFICSHWPCGAGFMSRKPRKNLQLVLNVTSCEL